MASSKISDHSLPISIVIASIILGAAIFFSGGSTNTPIVMQGIAAKPVGTPPSAQPAAAAPTNVDIKNVKIGTDPYIGKASAPLVMAYWYDYQCSYCKQAEQTLMPSIIKEYVDTGKIRVVFKDFQFLSADSETIGLAARAVWQVAPAKFYPWFEAIFAKQGREATPEATLAKIKSVTTSILGAADTDKVMALMVSNAAAYKALLAANKTEGGTFGVRSTPSFVIGKQLIVGARPYADVKAAIDAALK